ncbi:hypothetical protein CASFOL_002537 [Castilleja foliolosa]|uniref:Cupin-like domain-containing protein n=1 Tax=Castilleja foliolosa TaxID=1961234 RepID=A0ABD3EI32_9LAMI
MAATVNAKKRMQGSNLESADCLHLLLLDLVMASDLEKTNKTVAYLQQQNDCFRGEYGPLAADCEEHVPWATEVLGWLPEAVNLWIGNDLSETSFHKDHYENLYFTLKASFSATQIHRQHIPLPYFDELVEKVF